MKTKKKAPMTWHKGLFLSAAVLATGYFLGSNIADVYTLIALKSEIRANEARLEEVSAQKEELETTKKNLTNPDYIEYLARGKYLVTKDGEQIFKFPAIEKSNE